MRLLKNVVMVLSCSRVPESAPHRIAIDSHDDLLLPGLRLAQLEVFVSGAPFGDGHNVLWPVNFEVSHLCEYLMKIRFFILETFTPPSRGVQLQACRYQTCGNLAAQVGPYRPC